MIITCDMDRPSGGRVEVSYAMKGDQHVFCVADNGPGISQDQHKKVFCVFRRVEGPVTSKISGKGVGLALVKSIAANYDGQAWVESTPGQGSNFFISLSQANTADSHEPAGEADVDVETVAHTAG